jgi:glycosyltransferase involved in cell wall biosynthesis
MESLLNQEYNDYEIILVNDGSTDSSGNLCNNYVKKHQNIKVIHKKNEGLLMARRSGIAVAEGKYIMHCDSDDYLKSDTLLRLHKILLENDYDMILFGYDVLDDEGNVLEHHNDVFEDKTVFKKQNKEKIIYELVSSSWLNNMVTKVCKREKVDRDADYRSYKEIQMGEDLFQVIPLIENCETFLYLAESLYCYRYNQKGMSKNYKISYLYNYFMISERLLRLCDRNHVEDGTYDMFYNRFQHDTYKYMLRFLLQDISKEDYKKIFVDLDENRIMKEARERRKQTAASNYFLRFITNPAMYQITKCFVKIFLKRKLV